MGTKNDTGYVIFFSLSALLLFFLMPQLLIFFGLAETNLDVENSVRRRSRNKSMPESGAREHKEQLQKLSEKVGFVALVFLRTFYKY